jgi:hypothetical protein
MTKTPELPDLVPLHEEWQTKLNAMIAGGTSYVAAAESMITVALAAKVQAEGPRAVSLHLAIVAGTLKAMADQQEAAPSKAQH